MIFDPSDIQLVYIIILCILDWELMRVHKLKVELF